MIYRQRMGTKEKRDGGKRRAQGDDPTRRQQADDTKRRLLLAAIDVFGRHGFDGASTRMLAEAGGVNLQSIAYYFGSKEGLYLAVAEHIGGRVQERVGPVAVAIRERIGAAREGRLPKAEAAQLLGQLLTAMAHLLLHDESAPWARYMIREQMEPTAAFEHLYGHALSPTLGLVRSLLACILRQDPESEQIRLRTIATMGQVLVLRAACATMMRQLGWKQVGERELAAVDTLIVSLVEAIAAAPSKPTTTAARKKSEASAARPTAHRKPRRSS